MANLKVDPLDLTQPLFEDGNLPSSTSMDSHHAMNNAQVHNSDPSQLVDNTPRVAPFETSHNVSVAMDCQEQEQENFDAVEEASGAMDMEDEVEHYGFVKYIKNAVQSRTQTRKEDLTRDVVLGRDVVAVVEAWDLYRKVQNEEGDRLKTVVELQKLFNKRGPSTTGERFKSSTVRGLKKTCILEARQLHRIDEELVGRQSSTSDGIDVVENVDDLEPVREGPEGSHTALEIDETPLVSQGEEPPELDQSDTPNANFRSRKRLAPAAGPVVGTGESSTESESDEIESSWKDDPSFRRSFPHREVARSQALVVNDFERRPKTSRCLFIDGRDGDLVRSEFRNGQGHGDLPNEAWEHERLMSELPSPHVSS